jgi:hypothetical protein
MFVNEYVAMQLHTFKQRELQGEGKINRALIEIINEFKADKPRRNRKSRRI